MVSFGGGKQIYNWFKNTVGRTRRKLEGRPRSAKKVGEKGVQRVLTSLRSSLMAIPASSNTQNDLTWNTDVAAPTIIPYTQGESSTSPINPPQTIITPVQYGGLQPSSSVASSIPTAPPSHSHTPHTPHPHVVSVNINQSTLRDAFLQGVDPSTLASMIQSYVITNPSPIPLTPVVDALYDVISTESNSFNREPHPYLRRFLDASNYFPPSIIHADVSGPHAGPRALQMQIRKYSTWIPNSIPRPSAQRIQPQTSSSSSITDEMRRIATDRQRRKDHIQWAHIHAAALELGMLVYGESDNTWYAWRTFSELMAKDAVWETDEVEWVAGICVLRAVIRTAVVVDLRQRDEYDELLRAYERRWKEIKDEARQALVTVS